MIFCLSPHGKALRPFLQSLDQNCLGHLKNSSHLYLPQSPVESSERATGSQLLILSGLGRVDIGRRDVPGLSFIVQLLERARMGSYGLALVAHTHTHTPLPVTIKICPKKCNF